MGIEARRVPERVFSSARATTIRAGVGGAIVVGMLAVPGLVTSPMALGMVWLACIAGAIPTRWHRIVFAADGVSVQRGFGVLFDRGRFVPNADVRKVQHVLTPQLHLYMLHTSEGRIRVEASDLPDDELLAEFERRFGEVEILDAPHSLSSA